MPARLAFSSMPPSSSRHGGPMGPTSRAREIIREPARAWRCADRGWVTFQAEAVGCLKHAAREVRRAAVESVAQLEAATALAALHARLEVEDDAGLLEFIAQRVALLDASTRSAGSSIPAQEGQPR